MKFYIDGNIITTSEVELQGLTELDAEQIAFYIANRQASVQEVLSKELSVHVPSLDELKSVKLNDLNTHFETIFANGYEDVGTGWTLFCGESNVLDYATLKNAIMDMDDAQVVEIGTFTGWQTSTKSVVYPLLKRYSLYMLPLTTTYRKLKTMIEYCDTKENLELIQW